MACYSIRDLDFCLRVGKKGASRYGLTVEQDERKMKLGISDGETREQNTTRV